MHLHFGKEHCPAHGALECRVGNTHGLGRPRRIRAQSHAGESKALMSSVRCARRVSATADLRFRRRAGLRSCRAGQTHEKRRSHMFAIISDGAEDTLASGFKKARFWETYASASFNDRRRAMMVRHRIYPMSNIGKGVQLFRNMLERERAESLKGRPMRGIGRALSSHASRVAPRDPKRPAASRREPRRSCRPKPWGGLKHSR
ncbi:hypothetical protein MHY1_p00164 (plasmid) [Methylovirgula sp. HY1]|nr:hypothetical protein MHY1_p00164 [Methylovirgula sp. HY1]